MNILFVVPYVPSLVRTRSYNLIRQLSARNHRVIVATLWKNEREAAEVEELRTCCDEVRAVQLPAWRSLVNCVQALPSDEPLQGAYSWSAGLMSQILDLQAKVDVVHVEHLRGARYGLRAKSRQSTSGVPVVWDSVDCISHLFEQAVTRRRDQVGRLVTQLELSRTRRYEGWLWRQFDRVLITSHVDRDAMTALGQGAPANGRVLPTGQDERISVLPNGVDTSYFTPGGDARHPRRLIFSGKMSYHANVSAVMHLMTDIMPLIWAKLPDVELMIVGKDPVEAIRNLAARHAGLVTVTGTVPDIRPFLRQASAAVIPLVYGAGSQFKVLEAMACGTPVVATPQAVAPLKTQPGRDVLVAKDPQAFADATVDLLENPRKQREMGHAGRLYVEAHHRWDQIAGRLEAIYEDVLAERDDPRHAAAESLLSA